MSDISLNKSNVLKKLLILSLLTAISVILERFLGYNDRVLSVSIAFLPIALAGMLYGVIPAVVVSALADLIGAALFPSGPLDFRFTAIAAVKGAIYGLFLHRKDLKKAHVLICQLLVIVICHLTLNTLVISTIIGRGFFALLPLRALKNLLMYPLEVFLILKMIEYRPTFERLTR
ncbi:MAG: folate family ECF transporter S component [Clostridiales bacterium]|jgi:ECF transporter S component (folate family)|nr:folate family ECF transporter S component [Clostridiales bacterium]